MNPLRLITRFVSSIIQTLLYAVLFPKRKKQKLRKSNVRDAASSIVASHHRSITPPYWVKSVDSITNPSSLPLLSNMTLRQFLSHPDGFHLAVAPAFYGYFAYFGALIAFHEMDIRLSGFYKASENVSILPVSLKSSPSVNHKILLQSISGASAGAMAATMIASGADPRDAADYVSSLTLPAIADPPGFLAIFKGRLVEHLIDQFFEGARLEQAVIPVAVTAFDLLTRKTKILNQGSIGRAVRASLSYPGLFQPVLCRNLMDATSSSPITSLLVDGVIQDPFGLMGLSVLQPELKNKRIVNMILGGFGGPPPGPSRMPSGIHAAEVVSISIKNTPDVSPLKMRNGPKAVRAAKEAVADILDAPMYHGKEPGHYILPIDASMFGD